MNNMSFIFISHIFIRIIVPPTFEISYRSSLVIQQRYLLNVHTHCSSWKWIAAVLFDTNKNTSLLRFSLLF